MRSFQGIRHHLIAVVLFVGLAGIACAQDGETTHCPPGESLQGGHIIRGPRGEPTIVGGQCKPFVLPAPLPTPPAEGWLDAITANPSLSNNRAPYDLVTLSFDPDNNLPLNPMLGAQTVVPPKLAATSMCQGKNPWTRPCTTQQTWLDTNMFNVCRSGGGPIPGHANWGRAIYEGTLFWGNHSHWTQDDDYSFAVRRADFAGVTQNDVDHWDLQDTPLHSEFNSEETINHFHTWFWDQLHQSVDADAGKGGVYGSIPGTEIPVPDYSRTRAVFDNKEAIVMGLYGLDCAHFCGAELHPVYAMAVHVKNDPEDDTWAIFVRNWGDEGYCSSSNEEIDTGGQPFVFTFRFKRPTALGVSVIGLNSDPSGRVGSVFYGSSKKNGAGIQWSGAKLIPNQGATVTFILPPASDRGRIDGMLHLKWSLGSPTAVGTPQLLVASIPSSVPRDRAGAESEGESTPLVRTFTPAQMTTLEHEYRDLMTLSSPVKIEMDPSISTRPTSRNAPVKHIPDPVRTQWQQRLFQELSKAERRAM